MPCSEDEFDSRNPQKISKAELRKTNKPIMEKKRRARINNCLNELKDLLLEAMKKDPARHSKLEKADILELTVKHLQAIQRQHLAAAVAADPAVLMRFKSGFGDCATEVKKYLSRMAGVPQGLKGRLGDHLSTCINGLGRINPIQPAEFPTYPPQQRSYDDFDINARRHSAFQYVRRPLSPPASPFSYDSTCDSSTEPETPELTLPILPTLAKTFPTPPSRSNSDQDSSPETQRPTVSSTTISPEYLLLQNKTKQDAVVIDVDNYQMTTPVRPKDYAVGKSNPLKRHIHDIKVPIPIKVQVISHTDLAKASSSRSGEEVSNITKEKADTSRKSPDNSKPADRMWRPW